MKIARRRPEEVDEHVILLLGEVDDTTLLATER